ncbi:Zinc finger CCCH domain-containing protein 16 [Melia azedarach]|uniref:Zinc finger CCCH domain-containing protein 16 n=1 Tax=Melia azedarach TaxID=155640 RepID=A0ACC1XEZ2_MELAZ|nr:Zinc finger CCCH domain-containing protein 16 [Melia azedarach]
MHYKKEPCRNFQRGSCQYGERCKFLHVTLQHPKPNNAFGFGTQAGSQQQQKPNPFGFGVQGNPQPKAANNFGNKQNQYKPFENKWSRISSIANSNTASSRQPDNQPQSANHKCTDPDHCKQIIAQDFEHERPLWKLTCYGHWRNAPCDIVGDISYEELRAAAYDEAKRGLSLQSIVERERNLLNSKLMEFDNVLRTPYTGPFNSALVSQNPFPPATPNAFSLTPQNSAPPAVSSFSQLGSSLNTGLGTRPFAPSNNALGQPNSSSNSSMTSGVFGINNLPSANAGPFDSQFPAQAISNPFTSNITSFNNSGVVGAGSNKFSAPASSNPTPFSFGNQPSIPSIGPVSSSTATEQATTNIQLVKSLQSETITGDTGVWLKDKWIPGEIPEEAPPEAFV